MWRLSDRDQLALELNEPPPRNAEELRSRLQRLGLGSQYRVRLTSNRTVVVSYSGGELRIHNSFLDADEANGRYFKGAPGRCPHFDLEAYVAARLAAAGIASVEPLGLDTYADPDRFFSYRRATHNGEPDYGRQISLIGIA